MSSEFFEGFTNIQIDHTRRCTVSYPQENTIELCGVPFNKKERMYMCMFLNVIRSREVYIVYVVAKIIAGCKKERLALFVIQNFNELEVVYSFTTK